MKKEKLVSTLHHVAIKNDSKEVSALLMVCMTELMKSHDGIDFRAKQARRKHAIADDDAAPCIIELTIHYDVRDQKLVHLAWRLAFGERLRLEPLWFVGDNRAVSDGVLALCDERPVLTIAAMEDSSLSMQFGGFEESAVCHMGNLMELSRQVIENGRE